VWPLAPEADADDLEILGEYEAFWNAHSLTSFDRGKTFVSLLAVGYGAGDLSILPSIVTLWGLTSSASG